MTTIWTKIGKTVAILFISFLLLFIGIALLIQIPSVQTYVVQQLTHQLSKQLDTQVKVGSVNIRFFKTIVLDDIYIADQNKDTLLTAEQLRVNIDLFNLLQQKIEVGTVGLTNAQVNINRQQPDRTFNYQFVVDAFSSPDTLPQDTTPFSWQWAIHKINLEKTKINFYDELEQHDFQANLQQFNLSFNQLDLDQQLIAIDELVLNNSAIKYTALAQDIGEKAVKQSASNTIDSTVVTNDGEQQILLVFPDVGWDISIDQIRLNDNALIYNDANAPSLDSLPNALDFNHLNLKDVQLAVDDLHILPNDIRMDINRFHFLDQNSQLEWKDLQADLQLDSTQLIVDDFVLELPNTSLKNRTALQFKEFTHLLDDPLANIAYQTNFESSTLALSDLLALEPSLAQQIPNLQTQHPTALYIDGAVNGNGEQIELQQLHVAVGEYTFIKTDATLTHIADLDYNQINIEAPQLIVQTNYKDVENLTKGLELPDFSRLGTVHLQTTGIGNMNDLVLEELRLTTESTTQLKGKAQIQQLMNPDQLAFDANIEQLTTHYKDIAPFAPDAFPTDAANLGKIQLQGQFKGSTNAIDAQNVVLNTESYTQFKGDVNAQNMSQTDQLTFDANVEQLTTHYKDIAPFAPDALPTDAANLGKIQLKGQFKGSTNAIDAQNVVLNTESYTQFRGDVNAQNMSQTDQLTFDANVEQLTTHYKDIAPFARDALPTDVANLGKIQLQGQFKGSTNAIDAQNVVLNTESYTQFRGDVNAQNMSQTDQLIFDANVEQLTTHYKDIAPFVPDALPSDVVNLGEIQLKGQLKGSMNSVDAKNIVLNTESHTQFKGDVKANNVNDLDQLTFDADIQQLMTHYKDISPFVGDALPPDVEKLGVLQLVGQIKGTTADLKAQNIIFQTESDTYFSGNARLQDVLDTTRLAYDVAIQQLTTTYEDIVPFVGESLPLSLAKWGKIAFTGQAKGTLNDVVATNITLDTESTTQFRGDVTLNNFSNMEELEYDLHIQDFKTVYDDFADLVGEAAPPELARLGKITVKGQATGNLDNVVAKNIQFTTESDTQFAGDVTLQHISDTVQLRYDLAIQQLHTHYRDFAPFVGDAVPPNLAQWGTLQLSGHLKGSLKDIVAKQVNFQTESETSFIGDATIYNFSDMEQIDVQAEVQQLTTHHKDFWFFAPEQVPAALAKWGTLRLSGQIDGNMEDLQVRHIVFDTDSKTHFKGDLQAKGILEIETAWFDLTTTELRTHPNDLMGFVEEEFPEQVQLLGDLHYQGDFKGTTHQFTLDGQLNTAIGSLTPDLFLDFNTDYSDATYKGSLAIRDVEVGQLLQNDSIGKVTLQAEVDGRGLSIETLDTELKLVVAEAVYNGYNYEEILVDGYFQQKRFTGNAEIDDPNITMDFSGLADFNDSIPNLQFMAHIDTINFAPLRLATENYALSAVIHTNVIGNHLDNLDGFAYITDLYLGQDSLIYHTDSISLTAQQIADDKKIVALHSDLLSAQIEGRYQIADLPQLLINFVNDFFPVDDFISPKDTPARLAIEPSQQQEPLADQQFTFEVGLHNPLDITQIFAPELTRLDTLSLSGRFDSREKELEMKGELPILHYADMEVRKAQLELIANTAQKMNMEVQVADVHYGDDFSFKDTKFATQLYDDSLKFKLSAQADTAISQLDIGGYAIKDGDRYRFSLLDKMILNKEKWTVDEDNAIFWANNDLFIQQLGIQNDQQRISISSEDPTIPYSPITVAFNQFRIKEISDLVNYQQAYVDGEVNGAITLHDYMQDLFFESQLKVQQLTLNEDTVGNLIIQADQASKRSIIDMDIRLIGKNALTLKGNYDTETTALDLSLNAANLKLALIDPFMEGTIRNTSGLISGNFEVKGMADQPEISGLLILNEASTHIDYLETHYTINHAEINIQPNFIQFNNLTIVDSLQQSAYLNGKVYHQYFDNIWFDLNFSTHRFQFLNTKAKDNALYYGTVFLGVNADVTGTMDLPKVQLNAATLPGTQLYTIPLAEEVSVVQQEDFIIFADADQFKWMDTLVRTNRSFLEKELPQYKADLSGIDLILNLEVTPETELQIIIDPTTGDKLVCRGDANLTVNLNPAGDMDVFGNYVIEEGSYSFSYEQVLRKQFLIDKGSHIDFVGNPYDAKFDITAIYETKTTTYDLVRNQSINLTPEEVRAAQNRDIVQVLLSIEGTLAKPDIGFDIVLPSNQQSILRNAVARKLTQIREDETELNKQVFGLLLFGGFIPSQSTTAADLAGASQTVALNSVSNLISQQLNKLADRYIKGLDISIGVGAYRARYGGSDGSGSTVTELQLGLSKQLFNDRLVVSVGSNVNLSSDNNNTQTSALSNITGDFVVEYKLTKSGEYRVKAFRRTDFDALQQLNNTKTGVGVFLKKSF